MLKSFCMEAESKPLGSLKSIEVLRMRSNRLRLILLLGMLSFSSVAYADGEREASEFTVQANEIPEATPNGASDASFDKRLPPVLPGEEVSDGRKKMKVWSTSGPVPVSPPPEPWVQGNTQPGSVSVIVDQRNKGTKRPAEPKENRVTSGER
jgi:hypothetical protein